MDDRHLEIQYPALQCHSRYSLGGALTSVEHVFRAGSLPRRCAPTAVPGTAKLSETHRPARGQSLRHAAVCVQYRPRIRPSIMHFRKYAMYAGYIRVKTRVACFVHARHAVQADAAGVGENQQVPDNQNALLSIGNPAVIGADHLRSLWNQHETASRGVIYIFSHARARLSWKIGIQPAFERGGNDPAGLDLERRHRVLLFGAQIDFWQHAL